MKSFSIKPPTMGLKIPKAPTMGLKPMKAGFSKGKMKMPIAAKALTGSASLQAALARLKRGSPH